VWEGLTEQQQEIIRTAMDSMALKLMTLTLVENGEALATLPDQGVTIYDWSAEDRATFREAAIGRWDEWAKKTPETQKLVDSHKAFLDRIGLGGE
jgi:TRAP-type C4-dicarboxylate transport system substrate-binding protein